DLKEFFFGDRADIMAEIGEQQGRIEVALVIGDEDICLIGIEVFKALHMDPRAGRTEIYPAPEFRQGKDELFNPEDRWQDVADRDDWNPDEDQQQAGNNE